MTGMDMPWSWAAGATLGAGEPSTKSCLGGLTLQNTEKKKTLIQHHMVDLSLVIVVSNIWQSRMDKIICGYENKIKH